MASVPASNRALVRLSDPLFGPSQLTSTSLMAHGGGTRGWGRTELTAPPTPSEGRVALLAAAGAEASEEGKFLGMTGKEAKKIVPLGMMFFCILFNYTILRDTKDVLVVTAPGAGAEIIPF